MDLASWWHRMRPRCSPLAVHEPIDVAELEARVCAAPAWIAPANRFALPPLVVDYLDVLASTTWYGHQLEKDFIFLGPRAIAERAEAETSARYGYEPARDAGLWISLVDAGSLQKHYLCVDRDHPLCGRVASSTSGFHPCWAEPGAVLDLGTFETWLSDVSWLRRSSSRGMGFLLGLTPEDLVELDPVLATGDPWALVVAARDLQHRIIPDRSPPLATCAPERVLVIHHPPAIDDLVLARFEDTVVALVPPEAMSRVERVGSYTAWDADETPRVLTDARELLRSMGISLFVGNFTRVAREEVLGRLLDEAPASSRLHACEALLEQAVAIETVLAPATSPLESAFGGEPYTPEDFIWPVAPDGRAMAFVGQVNFADVSAHVPPDVLVPRDGLLQLFCATYFWPGAAPDAGMRVVWHPQPEAVRHHTRQAPEPPGVRAAMRFRSAWSAPDVWTLLPERWLLDFVERDTDHWLPEAEVHARRNYQASIEHLSSHQLFGHAGALQCDPRLSMTWRHAHGVLRSWSEWYGAHRALLAFDDVGHVSEADIVALWQLWMQTTVGRQCEAERDTWRLLWQIDTDDALGLAWGDLGRLFVMIRREDLAANDLSLARIEWQAH